MIPYNPSEKKWNKSDQEIKSQKHLTMCFRISTESNYLILQYTFKGVSRASGPRPLYQIKAYRDGYQIIPRILK